MDLIQLLYIVKNLMSLIYLILGDDVQNDGFESVSCSSYLDKFDPSVNIPQEYIYTVSDECNTESSSVLNLDNTESQPTVELQLCDNDPIMFI